jgi:prophage maintenance system killer protein
VAVTHHVCVLNGHGLEVPADDAVCAMLDIAAGEVHETEVAAWIMERLHSLDVE